MSRKPDGYWGFVNPSLYWLLFLPPFLAFGMGYLLHHIWGAVAVGVAATLLGQHDRPFSFLFYIGPLVGLIAAYDLAPQYALMALLGANIWMNFAIFLPKGDNESRIYESLFSSKLLGLMLMIYVACLVLFDLRWYGDPLLLGWIPSGILLAVYVVHAVRNYLSPTAREIVTLLPVARVAVIRGDKVLLRRDGEGTYDLPFAYPVIPGEDPYRVVEEKMSAITDHKPKYLLKYKEETKEGERVNFLYVLNLRHGEPFDYKTCAANSCLFMGKEEADKCGRFSKALKEEYQYLSSTIFLTNSTLSRL